MELSQAQKEAVETINGQVILISCPGSGKTSTVVRRVEYMVENGIPADRILVLTFSKAAAVEMKERFLKLSGQKTGADVCFATIHSFCYNVIAPAYRITGRNILRTSEAWMTVRKGLDFLKQQKKLTMDIRDYTEFTNSCIREISVVNNNGADWDTYRAQTCPTAEFRCVYELYEEQKRNMGKIDFDDMLRLCYRLFTDQPEFLRYYQDKFRYIIVDEYQDTNFLQRDILYLLAGGPERANLCVVGDDDQSIYKFRGARPEIMLNFAKTYPDCKQLYMDVNYRSEPCIVEAARRLIEHNQTRFKKDIKPFKTGTGVVETKCFATSGEEAAGIAGYLMELNARYPYDDMAVLYRNNQQASLVCLVLMKNRIPFHTNDPITSPYQHWIFHDLMAYYRLANGTGDFHDLMQVINKPNRFVPVQVLKSVGIDAKEILARLKKSGMDPWKLSKLQFDIADFFQDLKLLQKDDPDVFVRMVRDMVGYESYLKSYAAYRSIDPTELTGILDSYVTDIRANGIRAMKEWQAYARSVNAKIDAVNQDKNRKGVAVSTCHKSKGLEWPVVVILGATEGVLPSKQATEEGNMEEERRLFYVAATRAKEHLCLSYIQNDNASKSRFINELMGEKKPAGLSGQPTVKFKKGQRVYNKAYGNGTILQAVDQVAAVKFDDDPRIQKINTKDLRQVQTRN